MGLRRPPSHAEPMPSRFRALFALPFAAMALAAPHPSLGARLATPKPVSPAPGAVSESLPVFGWNKVANADRYEFQVAADSGFNSPVIGAGEDALRHPQHPRHAQEDDPERHVLLARPCRHEGRRRVRVDDAAVLQARVDGGRLAAGADRRRGALVPR